MFDPDIILMYHHLRHQERIEEAFSKHLAEVAQSQRRPRYYETLAALGSRLVSWGEQLQARYSPSELIINSETVR